MKFRIQNIFLLVACYIYLPFRGATRKTPRKLEKILIIQMAKLGDMICTTPVFGAIKKTYPNARVYILGNKVNKDLLENNPHIDTYITYTDNIFEIIRTIRKEKIDVAYTLGPSLLSLAIAYLSNIPSIWVARVSGGFSPYETKPYRLARWLVKTYSYPMSSYVPLVYLKALEHIDIHSTDTSKVLNFSVDAKTKIDLLFKNNNLNRQKDFIVGIAPSVGHKIRIWNMEYFVEVINYLQTKHEAKIIILGSKLDKEPIDSLMTKLHNKQGIINTMGLFDLDQLKAVMSTLNMFVSVETGLTFIAEAFNIPLINIIGPVDEKENSPRGPLFKTITAKRDKPAMHVLNAVIFNHQEARRQIIDISAGDVILAIERLLQQQHK